MTGIVLVLLADGTQVYSSVVLSNATPYRTFVELVPENVLPDDFLRAIKFSDYSSCCKLSHPDAGPQHIGTIHIGSESMKEINSANQDALNGLPSQRPIIEMTIPSVLDKTIPPPPRLISCARKGINVTVYNGQGGIIKEGQVIGFLDQLGIELLVK